MARLYAQLAAVVFVVVGLGGLLTGDAGKVVQGQATGNVDGVALHLTHARDVLDLLIAVAFGYAGWWARASTGRSIVLGTGAVLLVLAAVGFALGDDAAGSRSIAGLHFPVAINIFDLVAGVLGVLCGLGSFDAEASPAG